MPCLSVGKPTLMGGLCIVEDGSPTHDTGAAHHCAVDVALHDTFVREQIRKAVRVLGVPPIRVLRQLIPYGDPIGQLDRFLAGQAGR
jgi:hypothetical protein